MLSSALTGEAALQDSAATKLRQEIKSKKTVAKQTKKELLRLTREERSMFSELAEIEDDIQNLENELFDHEEKLRQIKVEINRTHEKHAELQQGMESIIASLNKMLTALWPVHTKKFENKFGLDQGWEKADRRFTWLSSIYKDAKKELDRARKQEKLILANLEKQRQLKADAADQLDKINGTKDSLLDDKLALLSGIRKIRSLKFSREEELKDILSTINKLNYKLKTLTSKKITAHKGGLPWPGKGKVAVDFNLRAKPPVRGIGIKTDGPTNVQSIFWGKVVHNDTLRGFGRVVIIYHGYNYYSLYAYLSESFVKNGQEVEKDELIGKSGYYPKIKDSGLYFELRFHQKPVNPLKWLAH